MSSIASGYCIERQYTSELPCTERSQNLVNNVTKTANSL